MSRTYKDRPTRIRFPNHRWNSDLVDYPKQRRTKNTEWNWLGSTPSWWTRLMMNRPMRARGRAWEHQVLRHVDVELEPPGVSHKPHRYYW